MISFPNNSHLVENLSELPPLPDRIQYLYADWETSSGDPKYFSTNPWQHCNAHLLAFTWDDNPKAYCVPASMAPWEYFSNMLRRTKCWVNHNISYDLNVTSNCTPVEIPEALQVICTLTSAKLIDSDRMSYALDNLSRDWLQEDISHYEARFKPFLRHPGGSLKNRDYGVIPTDILAEYAGQDALTERKLHKFIEKNLPADCKRVYQLESNLTKVLYHVEQAGMPLDVPKLVKDSLQDVPDKLLQLEETIHERVGKVFRPHVSSDLYGVLHEKYGLPIVERTDTGNPSFGKRALTIYSKYKYAPRDIISLIKEYKKWYKIHTSFLISYAKLLSTSVDHRIHPSINQTVTTGRMSMKEPNMQQLPPDVKYYIAPQPGKSIVTIDLSQIEFRVIAHYCGDERVIESYNSNPLTDYHSWVASIAGIDRRPAKTVNFLVGYGGGVARLADQLQEDESFIPEFDDFPSFNRESRAAAQVIMDKYHSNLPTLKRTMKQASKTLKDRGFLRNLFGRYRKMPSRVYSKKKKRWFDISYKAFNNASQSSAADFFKDRTVALWSQLGEMNLRPDVELIGLVHDDWVFHMPTELVPELVPELQKTINTIPEDIKFSVPIRSEAAHSDKSWGHCKD